MRLLFAMGNNRQQNTGSPSNPHRRQNVHALVIREPFATLIAMGHKKVETRRYRPPRDRLFERIGIVACNGSKSYLIGSCVIKGWFEYADRAEWNFGRRQHLVQPNTEFDWTDPDSKRFGWLLSLAEMDDTATPFKINGPNPWQKMENQ